MTQVCVYKILKLKMQKCPFWSEIVRKLKIVGLLSIWVHNIAKSHYSIAQIKIHCYILQERKVTRTLVLLSKLPLAQVTLCYFWFYKRHFWRELLALPLLFKSNAYVSTTFKSVTSSNCTLIFWFLQMLLLKRAASSSDTSQK